MSCKALLLPSLKLRQLLKMDGWNTTFLLGRPIFWGYVSFREGIDSEQGEPKMTRWFGDLVFFLILSLCSLKSVWNPSNSYVGFQVSHFSASIVNQPIKGNKRSVFVAYLRSEKVTKVGAVKWLERTCRWLGIAKLRRPTSLPRFCQLEGLFMSLFYFPQVGVLSSCELENFRCSWEAPLFLKKVFPALLLKLLSEKPPIFARWRT